MRWRGLSVLCWDRLVCSGLCRLLPGWLSGVFTGDGGGGTVPTWRRAVAAV